MVSQRCYKSVLWVFVDEVYKIFRGIGILQTKKEFMIKGCESITLLCYRTVTRVLPGVRSVPSSFHTQTRVGKCRDSEASSS
jgi:hypothetical protein